MRNLYENSSVFYGIEDIQLKKRLIIAFYVWLRNKDLHLRAAEALGCIGSPQAVELLIIALKDWDEGVRRCVVEALDKIGDPRALEPLRVALEDDDSSVRYRVAAALKKMEATPRQQQPDVENKNIRRTDMLDIDSERLITTMTDSMEETNVRLAAVMKVTQEAVATEAAKGSDARARLAGTLFVAAVNGDLRVATRCLDLGIDPNWPRRNGTDVLRDIVGMGDARLEITKILISRGADPNVGTIPVLRQIQGSAFCDNEKTIAFLRAIKARE